MATESRDRRPPDAPRGFGRLGRSGDGFLHCEDGKMRWGRHGAAGALFVVRAARGVEALMQLRSARAHEGGTWSCPGGAIDRGESPLAAALRETTEEVGAPPDPSRSSASTSSHRPATGGT